MRPAKELTTSFALPDSTPLLEEERHTRGAALLVDRDNPFSLQPTCPGPTFPSNDYPANTVQVYLPQVLQQWFDRQEAHIRTRLLKIGDPREAYPPVLNANSPPNVRGSSGSPKFAGK